MKNTVAGVAFCIASLFSLLFFGEKISNLGLASIGGFFASGFIGLAIGDYFLFRGYQRLGSARTIMIFSFSPVFLTLEGFLFFDQGMSLRQAIAVLLMMACAWTISFEKFRSEGAWEWRGIAFAMIGVFLDNIGVVLSRMAFDRSPETSAFTANAIRAVGALIPLCVAQAYWGEKVFERFGRLQWKDRSLVVFASFFGTFLSLSCWLTALKIGHIGSLAGVGSFNPVAASLWEWLLLRKRPTPYLIAAMSLFLSGFYLLMQGS